MTTTTAMSLSASSRHRHDQPLVLLAGAEGKRVRLMQAARAALGLAPARVLAWRDWLAAPALLPAALAQPCSFKIEPPGDDALAWQQLLAAGGTGAAALPAHGELAVGAAWFAGLAGAMERLAAQLAALPHVRVFTAPAEVLAMTDKLACQRHLQSRGVAVPALLGPVAGYQHLCALLDEHQLARVFIKARYGSSAAGVIAYRRNGRGDQQATTSAQLCRQGGQVRLFNNKRVRSYHDAGDIATLVDLLAAQEAYCEAWIDKPRSGAGHYDVRVVTMGGVPAHRVARVGTRMMTNLHLDNQRADTDRLLGPADAAALESCARHAAAAFPRSHVIGLDLVVRRGAAHVLEANAFGDLLPGLLWQAADTYSAQLRSFALAGA